MEVNLDKISSSSGFSRGHWDRNAPIIKTLRVVSVFGVSQVVHQHISTPYVCQCCLDPFDRNVTHRGHLWYLGYINTR